MADLIHGRAGEKRGEGPVKDGETVVVIGSPSSPYTLKVRAALTYQRRPMRYINRGQRDDAGYQRPKGPPLLPNVILPSGEALGDSTPILQRLDRGSGNRGIYPPSDVQRFLCLLVEDFADEWLTKCMFHYRWAKVADAEKAASVLPNFVLRAKDTEELAKLAEQVGQRQISRLGIVGSNAESKAVIEGSYELFLKVLSKVLFGRGFLFGERPSVADFAVYGQLTQLVKFDPTSSDIAAKLAPNVVAWVWSLDDCSGLSAEGSDWADATAPLHPLLCLIGSLYAPLLLSNHAACSAKSPHATVVTPLGTWTQPAFKYQAKCLDVLRAAYCSLSPAARHGVDAALRGTGCDLLFASSKL